MPPYLNSAQATHVGLVRSNNEDTALCDPKAGLWLVADGMGGHAAGEVASELAKNAIEQAVSNGSPLTHAIEAAHRRVLEAVDEGQGKAGMGSTVVALMASETGYEVAWVGDSRAYCLSRGRLRRLTTDHSYVQSLYDAGLISEQELDTHPDKNIITQCLGSRELEQVKVDSKKATWRRHDRLLLCSDGLSDIVSEERIARILNGVKPAKSAAEALIEEALESGGRDNVTVVVIDGPHHASSVWGRVKNLLAP